MGNVVASVFLFSHEHRVTCSVSHDKLTLVLVVLAPVTCHSLALNSFRCTLKDLFLQVDG